MIGYSMPAADEDARQLLLTKCNKNAAITLVCGRRSAQIRSEFERAGFKNVRVFNGLFKEFLALSA